MTERATTEDIDALVALRAAMFATMGHKIDPDASWRREASKWFASHLDVDACAYIVRVGDTAVAAALGYFHTAPPSPSSCATVTGHLSNVITLEGHRRRGHARACVQALIDWFRDETDVRRVDLAASEDGLALYESLGGYVAINRHFGCPSVATKSVGPAMERSPHQDRFVERASAGSPTGGKVPAAVAGGSFGCGRPS